jgi:acetyl esterase/lipase
VSVGRTFVAARRRFARYALGGVAALCSGCSAFDLANAFVPGDTYERTSGIAYGEHERHRLDVYRPPQPRAAGPVAVFFYGGNWSSGQRGDYRFVGEALASRGVTVVIPDYRLYPDVKFPDFLVDCATAVRWTTEHVGSHGADPKRLFLMGHSAGAYNAAMLALDAEYLRAARVEHSAVKGWIGLAGPYDFLPLKGTITRAVFGYPDTSPRTQPIHFVSKDDPPALLVTGSGDETVDPGNTTRLAARLRTSGVAVREIVYPGVSHTRLLAAMSPPFRGTAPVVEEVARFVLAG